MLNCMLFCRQITNLNLQFMEKTFLKGIKGTLIRVCFMWGKEITESADLISSGRSFQGLEALTANPLSPFSFQLGFWKI